MLLTLSTTHRPATDLGYLLRKNPARAQSFELSFGKAHVFYPEATLPLHRLLSHLYVLMPVLDNAKHYWVGDDEVAKLLRHGEGWLATHPERDAITRRYLKHQRTLVTDALAQLVDEAIRTPTKPPRHKRRRKRWSNGA